MIKNKKGFTLIEILAAITILGILTGIAVVSVTRIIENGKQKHYTTAEENMVLAGQSFAQQNRAQLPKAIGQKKKISMKLLVDKNYIQPIKDYSDNNCDMDKSYIQVFKYSQQDYSYVAYLDCPNYNSKENINDITPSIDAQIEENEEARTANAKIKITGNDKIVSHSYIVYRNNKEVKNTGNVQEKSLPATKSINFSLEDYTPGNIKIVVTATNIYGNTKTVTVTKNIPDRNKPKCIIKEEDKPTSPKPWINTGSRTIKVGCEDGETGSGCTREEYSKKFDSSMRTGTITIEDESGNKTECEVSVYIDKINPTITVNAYKRNSSGNKTGSVLKTVSTTTSSTSKTLDLTSISTTEWLNKANYPNGIYYEIILNDNLELYSYDLKQNATGLTKNHSSVNNITTSVANQSVSGTSKTKNHSIATDGYAKNKVVISDAAGNTATVTMTTPLDTTAPNVPNLSMYKWTNNTTTPTSASGLSTYTNDTWSNKFVYTVASGSTDAVSGLKEYQYTTTGTTTNNSNKAATTRNIQAEGISYIKYRACDVAGNCSNYTSQKTIKIDHTNPTCEVTGGSSTWINASSSTTKRTITATCVDNGSKCDSSRSVITKDYSTDINVTNAGAVGVGQGGTVYDNAGNAVNCAANQTVKIDKTAPTAPTISMYKWTNNSTTPTSASGLSAYTNNTWSNKNVYTVASGSTDATSGIKNYQFTTTGATTNESNTVGTTRNIKAEGTSTIKYRVCDNAGNCTSYSSAKTVKVDKTNPSCTVSGGNTAWINASSSTTSRTITATCSDGGSGCATSPLSTTYSSDINTTTAGAAGNGAGGTVYDNAGNSVACAANQTVKIDKTAPAVPTVGLYKWTNNSTTPTSASGLSAYTNDTWSNKNVYTVASGVTDATSGLKEYQFTTTGATTNATNSAGSTRNVQAEGTSYIKYRACDNAGNCSGYSTNYTVKIDKSNPSCTISGGSATWINASSSTQSRTITATCTDAGSGCSSSPLSYTYSSNINTTTAGAAGNGAGGTVYDNAGNSIACAANQTVKIDKSAPTLSSISNSKNGVWTNGNVVITATASDTGGSGISHTKYYYEAAGTRHNDWDSDSTKTSIKGTWSAERNQTVYLEITDVAGNVTSGYNAGVVKIDKTAPVISSVSNPKENTATIPGLQVTITGADQGSYQSGLSKLRYKEGSGSWKDIASSNYSPYVDTYTTLRNTTTFAYSYCDVAGNCSAEKTTKVKIVDACSSTTTTWSGSWGACSKSCGGGTQTMSGTKYSTYDGRNCGADSKSQSCNARTCCSSTTTTWSGSWGTCSKTCGGGTQTMSGTKYSAYDGSNCGADSKSQSCNTHSCEVPVNATKYHDCNSYYITTCSGDVCNYTQKNGRAETGTISYSQALDALSSSCNKNFCSANLNSTNGTYTYYSISNCTISSFGVTSGNNCSKGSKTSSNTFTINISSAPATGKCPIWVQTNEPYSISGGKISYSASWNTYYCGDNKFCPDSGCSRWCVGG